jgi:hypothetical protein
MKGEIRMPKSLPDIIYKQERNGTAVVDSDQAYYELPFTKSKEYFDSIANWTNFVKGVERLVRQSDKYSKYISYLKKECKLNRCMVLKDVTDDDADIEMHHGPILTLFDVCAIVTEYFILKQWKTTTFRVAKQVLQDHHDNMVQVVMLSSTVHEEVHAHNIFINYHQAWGDLNKFIDKYRAAIGMDYRYKINQYLEKCLLNDTDDHEILSLSQSLFKDIKKDK